MQQLLVPCQQMSHQLHSQLQQHKQQCQMPLLMLVRPQRLRCNTRQTVPLFLSRAAAVAKAAWHLPAMDACSTQPAA
jgi:hypothetical protein